MAALRTPIELKDDRAGLIRESIISDAEALRELDLALAEAGDGMVLVPEQVTSVEGFRERIRSSSPPGNEKKTSWQWLVLLESANEAPSRVIGELSLNRLRPALCNHVAILSLGIHPEFQRQGLGKALMTVAIEMAEAEGIERLELYTREDNHGAQALYRWFGFSVEGRRRGFVRTPAGDMVDDLIMARVIGDAAATTGARISFDGMRQEIQMFVAERQWDAFHDPKNLAMAVANEAGELLGELRWVKGEEADAHCQEPTRRQRVADEISDVAITLVMLADRIGLDLPEAMHAKMKKNRAKYPLGEASSIETILK
jgi:ribosomal protein S18 acetylase RimI-like enzyme/NTP pyrophosphatase (non-canonical NTP hydrolase)